jgi:hypothetical protein
METIAFAIGLGITVIGGAVLSTMVGMIRRGRRQARLQGATDLTPIPMASAVIIGIALVAIVAGLSMMAQAVA